MVCTSDEATAVVVSYMMFITMPLSTVARDRVERKSAAQERGYGGRQAARNWRTLAIESEPRLESAKYLRERNGALL